MIGWNTCTVPAFVTPDASVILSPGITMDGSPVKGLLLLIFAIAGVLPVRFSLHGFNRVTAYVWGGSIFSLLDRRLSSPPGRCVPLTLPARARRAIPRGTLILRHIPPPENDAI